MKRMNISIRKDINIIVKDTEHKRDRERWREKDR